MARYVEIERGDLQKLLDGYSYVLERYAETDSELCTYLAGILEGVTRHLENEAVGTEGHNTFVEIEFILDFLGAINGQ